MSIIIQAGHRSSYSDKLMQMLYERGLSKPINSQSRNLSAKQVAKTLAKIAQKSQSLINNRIIDNLTVDLVLANLDQDDWGWGDESNLDTLDYWQTTDPSARFILVFDSPKCLLKSLIGTELNAQNIDTVISEWIDYHKRLLEFFEENEHLSLLMEGDMAVNNLMNVKDKIQAITTSLDFESFAIENSEQLSDNSQDEDNLPQTTNTVVFDIIANEILNQYPECMQLYQQLLDKSSIRLAKPPLPIKDNLSLLIHSLSQLHDEEDFKKKMMLENLALKDKLSALYEQKQALEQKLNDNVLLIEQASKNEQQIANQAKQENTLLISQLHQVQEELEKYYLQNQKTAEQLKSVEAQKQQLQAQIDAKAKLEGELNLLKEAKQKAEQLANEQKKQAETLAQNKQKVESELASLKDAKQKAENLANEQKNKLQAETDAKKKLESEIANLKEVKQKSDNLAKEKQKLESELASLKETKQKADEQTKISNNAKQENELLISQLHQVQEELERYYLENQKLKSEQNKEPPKPVYYGAAERVKEDLPYRLGATMVNHSKSAKDLAVLPLALAKEYREFSKNKPSDNLPDLAQYQDADEAEKVKKHLSYRLGKTLVDGVKSKKVLDLPVKLGREIVGFGKK